MPGTALSEMDSIKGVVEAGRAEARGVDASARRRRQNNRWRENYAPVWVRIVAAPEAWAAGMASTSLLILLSPPALYESFTGEPAYGYLNAELLLYVLLCTVSFCVTCFLAWALLQRHTGSSAIVRPGFRHGREGAGWRLLVATVCVVEAARLAAVLGELGFSGLENIRSTAWRVAAAEAVGRWNLGLAGMATLAMWVRCSREVALMRRNTWKQKGEILALAISGTLIAVNQVVQGGRAVLFVLLIAMLLLVVDLPVADVRGKRSVPLIAIALLAGAWLAWSVVLRNTGMSGVEMVRLAVLYVVTAWNRAAAIMSGALVLPREGSGERVLSWLYYCPGVHSDSWRQVWGAVAGAEIPSPTDVWLEKFGTMTMASLDSAFNWTTIFGSVYVDLGWVGVAWFAVYGMFAGWARGLAARSVGVFCLYVWAMASIGAWLGANEIMVASPVTVGYVAGVAYGELVMWLAGLRRARSLVGQRRAQTANLLPPISWTPKD